MDIQPPDMGWLSVIKKAEPLWNLWNKTSDLLIGNLNNIK